MSRSRSLSYCSLSYSWRLIRFTRRRRRSGTAWGLEKAHTHTCMYMHTRTDQTCPSRQWERHTDAYMHAQTQLDTTQNRSELLFKYKYNWVSAHLNEWQLDQRRKLRKNKQTNNWAELLHFIIDDVLVRLTFSESDLMLRCCPRTWRRLDRPKHWNWINISAVSSTVEFSSAAFTWYLIPPLSSFVHVKTDLWALTYKRHLHRCLRIIRPQSLKSSNSIILPAKGQKVFEITTVTWLLLLRAQH